ncbi:transmembrane permease [Rufibacter sp. DG15C]|uniref:DMT family transporter n=1 Tax=Rufibacter sp. DG15C TaxID=1379909 RepID=UPI00078E01A9|nr:DMT family transporter [Rufibacter sp. DG15C]AMM51746.1 transmembrane permease [Rufibacter sp. DG15C]
MNQQVKVHGSLFLVALIYGANYSIAKEVMPEYVQPYALILWRVSGAVLFFWAVSLVRTKEKIQGWADWRRIILCGFFGIALNQLTFFGGLNLTSPINASLIMTITPIVVLVMSAVLLREKVEAQRIGGILLACAGAFLLIYGKTDAKSQGNTLGDILILVNATSYGIYLVLVKPLMQRYKAITVVSRVFLIGFIGVLPFGLPQIMEPDYASFPMYVWAAIAFMIIGVTIMAYLLNAWALTYASPSLLGVYIYLQPVLAILIAVVLGKDVFTWQKAVFALMIFGGVYLVSRPRKPAALPV